MTLLSRTALSAVALLALVGAGHAQPASDHLSHHPQAMPGPGAGPSAGMTGGPGGGMTGGGMMGMMRMMGPGQPGAMPMQGPMMGGPMMGGPGGMMGHMFEHTEGRIAFLKAELGITAEQETAWSAFADAFRQAADRHRTLHEEMMGGSAAPAASWAERLERRAGLMAARADTLAKVAEAAKPLYATMSADQKDKADRLLSGPMGMM